MPALAVPLAAAFPMASLAGAHRGRPILPIRPRLCPARARMMPRVRAVMDEKTKEAPNAPKEGVVGEWPAGILPPRELIPAGKLAVGGAAVYAAFTLDVTTLHLLQPFDTAVHDAVVAATTDEWRAFWARVVISDTSSILALLGTLGCLGVLAVKGGPKGWGIGALYSFLYFGFAGIIPHGFSYPSGHTTAGVFTMGMLLFVLLPAALEALGKDREGLRKWQPAMVAAWIASGAVTATGRILGEAHWVSDTAAGAAYSTFIVASAVLAVGAAEGWAAGRRGGDEA